MVFVPSCPRLFCPQQCITPVLLTAHAFQYPAERLTTSVTPAICTEMIGCDCSASLPSPKQLLESVPQATAVPSFSATYVATSPDATATAGA